MGDRCYVAYHFAETFGDLVERLLEEEGPAFGPIRADGAENGVVTFVEEEVNYGDTSDVEEVLGRHAISYDIEKGRGHEYDAVSVRARALRNGEGDVYLGHREWYEGDNAIDIPKLSRKLRTEGITAVTALIKEREDYITVLPIKDAVLEPEHEALLTKLGKDLIGRRARAEKIRASVKWIVLNREVYDQRVYEPEAVTSADEPTFRLSVQDEWEQVRIELERSDEPSLCVQVAVTEGVPTVLIGDVGLGAKCLTELGAGRPTLAVYRTEGGFEVASRSPYSLPEPSDLMHSLASVVGQSAFYRLAR